MDETSDQTFDEVEQLFHQARRLTETSRHRFMAALADRDAGLAGEVRSLLDAHVASGRFLCDSPFAELDAGKEREAAEQPERIGAYRVIRSLGLGPAAAVYLAHRDDGQFERTVAIKVLSRSAANGSLAKRFLAERQVLADLQQEHIARFYDGGVTQVGGDALPYIVMEYVDGLPLDDWCRERDVGLRDRLALFVDVCKAVGAAHAKSVIHRDLKPQNILVGEGPEGRGDVKVIDFGIAKLVADSVTDALTDAAASGEREPCASATLPGLFTPEYASPEQLRGGSLTTATDLYSLGVILREISADCLGHVAHAEELEAVIAMATEPKVTDRYASANALADDVIAFLNDRPVAANVHPWSRLRRGARRNWVAIVTAAACACVFSWLVLDALAAPSEIESLGEAIRMQQPDAIVEQRFEDVLREHEDTGLDPHAVARSRAMFGIDQSWRGQIHGSIHTLASIASDELAGDQLDRDHRLIVEAASGTVLGDTETERRVAALARLLCGQVAPSQAFAQPADYRDRALAIVGAWSGVGALRRLEHAVSTRLPIEVVEERHREVLRFHGEGRLSAADLARGQLARGYDHALRGEVESSAQVFGAIDVKDVEERERIVIRAARSLGLLSSDDCDRAIEVLDAALSIRSKSDTKDISAARFVETWADLNSMAALSRAVTERKPKEEVERRFHAALEQCANSEDEVRARFTYGHYLERRLLANQAIQMFESIRDDVATRDQVLVKNATIGWMHLLNGEMTAAASHLQLARESLTEESHPRTRSLVLANYAELLATESRFKEATEASRLALESLRRVAASDSREGVLALVHLATHNLKWEKLDRAIAIARDAVVFAANRSTPDPYSIALSKGILGCLLLRTRNAKHGVDDDVKREAKELLLSSRSIWATVPGTSHDRHRLQIEIQAAGRDSFEDSVLALREILARTADSEQLADLGYPARSMLIDRLKVMQKGEAALEECLRQLSLTDEESPWHGKALFYRALICVDLRRFDDAEEAFQVTQNRLDLHPSMSHHQPVFDRHYKHFIELKKSSSETSQPDPKSESNGR